MQFDPSKIHWMGVVASIGLVTLIYYALVHLAATVGPAPDPTNLHRAAVVACLIVIILAVTTRMAPPKK
jgi:heme A synthase